VPPVTKMRAIPQRLQSSDTRSPLEDRQVAPRCVVREVAGSGIHAFRGIVRRQLPRQLADCFSAVESSNVNVSGSSEAKSLDVALSSNVAVTLVPSTFIRIFLVSARCFGLLCQPPAVSASLASFQVPGKEVGKPVEWDSVRPVIQVHVICARHNQQLLGL
jgi:hypothetical protein